RLDDVGLVIGALHDADVGPLAQKRPAQRHLAGLETRKPGRTGAGTGTLADAAPALQKTDERIAAPLRVVRVAGRREIRIGAGCRGRRRRSRRRGWRWRCWR